MNKLFEPPISTSNLYEPELDKLWQIFEIGFDENEVFQTGKLVQQLESRLCDYHHSKFCVTFSTGFWALVAAIKIRAIPGRSEVVIPSMTYRRLADVVYWAGNIPVMVDIEPENLAVCPNAVEAAISDSTALILGVHPIVNCCDVVKLIKIAKQKNLPIVFDAVESVHETIAGQRVGSFGIGEVFSFHASKLINGIEGGYVCTDDEIFRNQLIAFRNQQTQISNLKNKQGFGESSILPDLQHGLIGVMNDAHAAYAIASMDELELNVAHNKQIYEAYIEGLTQIHGIDLINFDTSEQTSFKNIVARVDQPFQLSRDQLVARLNDQGILARAHYNPPLHMKRYQFPVKVEPTPKADVAMHHYINLPCGSRVSKADVRKTCQYLDSLSQP